MARKPPKVIKSYGSVIRNPKYPLQEFRVRVVQYVKGPVKSEVLLDIREYVKSDDFTGYSWKGISLVKDQVVHLANMLPDVIQTMTEGETNAAITEDETTTQACKDVERSTIDTQADS